MPNASTLRHPAAALLAWYQEMGVDECVGDEAVDLTRTSAEAPPQQKPKPGLAFAPPEPPGSAQKPRDKDGPIADARAAARTASTIAELKAALEAFEGCALKRTATNLVFADGVEDAEVMLVGEAPGADEDRLGRPFVGQSGQLLDRMLRWIGLDRRRNLYISNVLFWRPPGNRQPNPGEIAACLPFIERLIALKRPKILILAGATSASTMLGTHAGITRIRGQWTEKSVEGLAAPVPTLPILHPAYLLRQPAQKREAWADLIRIAERMDELGIARAD